MVLNKHHRPADSQSNVNIQRRTPLGNPLVMRRESERDAVVDGYREILEERATPEEIAGRYDPPLEVDEMARKVTREEREEAFARVLRRMMAGERVRLVCGCAPRRCHGDIIAARLCRMMRDIAE